MTEEQSIKLASEMSVDLLIATGISWQTKTWKVNGWHAAIEFQEISITAHKDEDDVMKYFGEVNRLDIHGNQLYGSTIFKTRMCDTPLNALIAVEKIVEQRALFYVAMMQKTKTALHSCARLPG